MMDIASWLIDYGPEVIKRGGTYAAKNSPKFMV